MHVEPGPGFRLLDDGAAGLAGRFAALDALSGIAHLVTTRDAPAFGPHADSPATRAAALAVGERLGLAGVAWCRQVHGGTVLRVTADGLAGDADALVTDRPGLALLGRSADCPLVLAAAGLDGRVVRVGMAHASWRSTVAGITGRMLAALLEGSGAGAAGVVAAICPSAGPCCYEVGGEVRDAHVAGAGSRAADFFRARGGRWLFDLWAANVDQLRGAGVPAAAIHVAGVCTLCRNDVFPSHRREGARAGRFAAAIGLREAVAGGGRRARRGQRAATYEPKNSAILP